MGKDLDLLMTLIRTEGPREALRRLAFRFLHLHTFVVLRMTLSADLAQPELPPGIELKEVSQEELRALRRERTDLPEYFYRDESQEFERCWVGLEGGRLGFVVFISHRGSSQFIRIGEHEAELAFIYSMPEFRGKRLSTNALLVIGRTLFDEGNTALWVVTHQENPASIKSFEGSGFVRIGQIKRLGFVTWPRTPVDFGGAPDAR